MRETAAVIENCLSYLVLPEEKFNLMWEEEGKVITQGEVPCRRGSRWPCERVSSG